MPALPLPADHQPLNHSRQALLTKGPVNNTDKKPDAGHTKIWGFLVRAVPGLLVAKLYNHCVSCPLRTSLVRYGCALVPAAIYLAIPSSPPEYHITSFRMQDDSSYPHLRNKNIKCISLAYTATWLDNPGNLKFDQTTLVNNASHFHKDVKSNNSFFIPIIYFFHTLGWQTAQTVGSESFSSKMPAFQAPVNIPLFNFHLALYEKTGNIPLNEIKPHDALLCIFSRNSRGTVSRMVVISKNDKEEYLYFDPCSCQIKTDEHNCARFLLSEGKASNTSLQSLIKLTRK